MVEYWNVGLNKEVTHFNASLSREILPIPHPVHYKFTLSPISPEPIIPSFQYSNCACPPSLSLRRGGRERSELSSEIIKVKNLTNCWSYHSHIHSKISKRKALIIWNYKGIAPLYHFGMIPAE